MQDRGVARSATAIFATPLLWKVMLFAGTEPHAETLSPAAAGQVVDRVRRQLRLLRGATGEVVVSRVPLPFYAAGNLLILRKDNWATRVLLFGGLATGLLLHLGYVPDLHVAIETFPPNVTAATAVSYLQFYCDVVHHDTRQFRLVGDGDCPPALMGRDALGQFLCSGLMIYRGVTSDVTIAVSVAGRVEMLDERPIRQSQPASPLL